MMYVEIIDLIGLIQLGRLIYQLIIKRLLFDVMNKMMHSESEELLLSPSAFMMGLNQPRYYSEEDCQNQNSYINGDKNNKISIVTEIKQSQKGIKKRQAGIKSRQKKKKYLQSLEQNVNYLKQQVEKHDLQLYKCKDQLVEAIKLCTTSSNQHAFTFNQLQKTTKTEDPDLDKINLLLDLIQNRIGANAKERQSKLQYNFKQIINSLFPAMHRYFMDSAIKNLDLFKSGITAEGLASQNTNWTKIIFQQTMLDQNQINKISRKKGNFIKKRHETINLIKKLKKVKEQIKIQEQIFEKAMTHFRQDLNPIQSSLIILFGEKNKLRKEFYICQDLLNEEHSLKKKIKLQ